jgi:OmpA-OmpF porin, OOP family
MRSARYAALFALLAVGSLPVAAGCGGDPIIGDGGATAIVAGGRSNMPAPRIVGDAHDWISEAIDERRTIMVVGVSGLPRTLHREKITTRCDSDRACEAFHRDYVKKINSLLGEVKADSAEADTLGAILEAARQLENVDGPKQIIVIDNGLQTTGQLRMQAPGAFGVDPDELAKQLRADDRMKTLDGIHILLTGIGSYAEPQAQLPGEMVAKLEALWRSILRDAGAEVSVDTTNLRGSAISGLPAVTVVHEDEPVAMPPTGCVRLREDQVGFLPNQATLRDPAKAKDVLTPIAAELRRKRISATVTGTTALPENPPYPLSLARAKTVIDILVGLGVKRSALTPVGVGINFQGYDPPYNSDRSFNETMAVRNRLVIVAPAGASCPPPEA